MREYKNSQIGDTVRVQFKSIDEGSERIQNFEGTLIKIRGQGAGQTLTVRKMSFGVGVERIFPTASPRFVGITSARKGKVRRAKLYYMRQLTGKSHRVSFEEEGGEKNPKASIPSSSAPSTLPAKETITVKAGSPASAAPAS